MVPPGQMPTDFFSLLRPLSPFKSPKKKLPPLPPSSSTTEKKGYLRHLPSSLRRKRPEIPKRIDLIPASPASQPTPDYLSAYDDFFNDAEFVPTRPSETEHIAALRRPRSGAWLKVRKVTLSPAEAKTFTSLRASSNGPILKSQVLKQSGFRRPKLTPEIRNGGEYWDQDPFTGETWIVQWSETYRDDALSTIRPVSQVLE